MKLSINRGSLVECVSSLSRVVTTRSTLQALSGIRFDVADNKVEMMATDLELCIAIEVDAETDGSGSFVVPGRLFVDIVKSLSDDKVEMQAKPESGELGISCGGAVFSIKTLLEDDFPKMPTVESKGELKVDAKSIVETFEWVEKSSSQDETRPILTSVHMEVNGDTLKMVATDSYRLSLKETKLKSPVQEGFEVNIPARAVREIGKLSTRYEDTEIKIEKGEGQILFTIGRDKMTSRLIEGQFPNYKQLIPEKFDTELKINSAEMQDVIKRVGLMAQKNTPLKLSFSSGKLAVSAQTPDVGTASDQIPVPYSGEDMEIGFNPEYIRDGLESSRSDEIVLKMINPLRPTLIESDDGRYVCLIMPVRLNT